MRRLFAAVLLLAAVSCGRRADPLPGFPRLVLWAWERPEHLGFVDPHLAGVAFLARTIIWKNGIIEVRSRRQPLELAPGTAAMAVVRLESGGPPLPDAAAVANQIRDVAGLPQLRALQVDFDAVRSERTWYASLLKNLRQTINPRVPLGITALASWCLGDPWLRGLPVDDAVPMLFRMGAGEPHEVREFSIPVCRASLGISTDELPYALPRGRRLFVFHPRPWTAEAYRGALQLARRWQ